MIKLEDSVFDAVERRRATTTSEDDRAALKKKMTAEAETAGDRGQ